MLPDLLVPDLLTPFGILKILFRVFFSGQRFRLEWLSSCLSQLRLIRKWSNHVVSRCAVDSLTERFREGERFPALHLLWNKIHLTRIWTSRQRRWRQNLVESRRLWCDNDPLPSQLCTTKVSSNCVVLETGTSALCDLNFFLQANFIESHRLMTHESSFYTFDIHAV